MGNCYAISDGVQLDEKERIIGISILVSLREVFAGKFDCPFPDSALPDKNWFEAYCQNKFEKWERTENQRQILYP